MICIDDIFEIDSVCPDIFVRQLAKVTAMAFFVHAYRCLRARHAARGEAEAGSLHVRMSVHLERMVGAAAKGNNCSLEETG